MTTERETRMVQETGALFVSRAILSFAAMDAETQELLRCVAEDVAAESCDPDDRAMAVNTMIEFLWPSPPVDLATGEPEWTTCPEGSYRLLAALIPEAEGGFSIIATRLPGCASQGETREEAIANIKEAFRGCVLSYHDAGEPIPLHETDDLTDIPATATRLSLTVTL